MHQGNPLLSDSSRKLPICSIESKCEGHPKNVHPMKNIDQVKKDLKEWAQGGTRSHDCMKRVENHESRHQKWCQKERSS